MGKKCKWTAHTQKKLQLLFAFYFIIPYSLSAYSDGQIVSINSSTVKLSILATTQYQYYPYKMCGKKKKEEILVERKVRQQVNYQEGKKKN